jgi:hypothetical protein
MTIANNESADINIFYTSRGAEKTLKILLPVADPADPKTFATPVCIIFPAKTPYCSQSQITLTNFLKYSKFVLVHAMKAHGGVKV